jgi:AcrR family transcriptional regulator
MPGTSPPREARAPRPTRRDAVRSALTELFLAEGFAGLSTDAIAARLSCSKATLYSIARSRSALIEVVASGYFRDSGARAERAAVAATAPDSAVRAYLASISLDLRRASPSFIADLEAHPATAGLYARNTRFAARRVSELAAGTDEATDPYLQELVTAVMFHLHAGGFRAHGVDDAEAVGRLADILSAGIEPARRRS